MSKEIKTIGSQFGEDKIKTYHRADLFVLPTYSENFGILLAEALACGVPVITTKGTPWEDLSIYGAGW
ncbi:glycosyltransferase [Echinicola marina]|uniref:glycosyltransferase n=1 Tax=Echinicola marina TaxID=2859768 RepID=UPI001CF6ACFE|nr:glycosyltransferase [Echinicola marina]UCS95683.1 glycosyltransferase [Echinicola marina]